MPLSLLNITILFLLHTNVNIWKNLILLSRPSTNWCATSVAIVSLLGEEFCPSLPSFSSPSLVVAHLGLSLAFVVHQRAGVSCTFYAWRCFRMCHGSRPGVSARIPSMNWSGRPATSTHVTSSSRSLYVWAKPTGTWTTCSPIVGYPFLLVAIITESDLSVHVVDGKCELNKKHASTQCQKIPNPDAPSSSSICSLHGFKWRSGQRSQRRSGPSAPPMKQNFSSRQLQSFVPMPYEKPQACDTKLIQHAP